MSLFGIIIDLIIIALLLIFGLIGLKKGFFKSLLSLFSWAVCIAIACFTAKYVANWICGIYDFSNLIGKNIANGLNASNEFYTRTISSFADKQDIVNNIPSNTNGILKQIIKIIFSNSNVDMSSANAVSSFVGLSIGRIIVVVATAILIFIVLKIVIAILSKIFDNIARTKVFGGLNKFLGLLFGLVKAGFIIAVINCILVGLSLIPLANKTIIPIIQNHTYVEKFVYNTTDKLVGKYVIEGNMIQTFVTNLWESR